jgi:hypothetical protein
MENKEEYSFGFPYDKKELIMENKEKEPVYGDIVWVRDSEDSEWDKRPFAAIINGVCCTFTNSEFEDYFDEPRHVGVITLNPWSEYRTTDPALDKKTLKLSPKEIAEKYGVDEVIINEKKI